MIKWLRRAQRNAVWNWTWWLISTTACGVIAWHVDYHSRWVTWALCVLLIYWVVPTRAPRFTPYPRCKRCHNKILPGQDTVSRLRGQDGPARWRMHTECWNAERYG